MTGTNLADRLKVIQALSNTAPAASTPKRVHAGKLRSLLAVIQIKNSGTAGNNGIAVTLKQAQDASGTGEKGLTLPFYYANADDVASELVAKTNASGDTFTTANTASKTLVYLVPVNLQAVDNGGGFSFVRVAVGDSTGSTATVTYVAEPIFGGNAANMPTVLS